jgi:pantothenate kinase-related protein Tda10
MSSPLRDTIDREVRGNGKDKTHRVDLGLALLAALRKPGRTLTSYDIAAWCGCTNEGIRRIEMKALKKLANRLQFGRDRAAWREHAA